MREDPDRNQKKHQKQYRARQKKAEVLQPVLERRGLRGGGETRGDVAKRRLDTCRDYERAGRPAHHGGAEKHHVLGIWARRYFIAAGVLFYRQRLAGQCRLLNVQIARFDEPRVRWDDVSCRQPHDIAGNDPGTTDVDPISVTQHGGLRGDPRPQLLDGLLRAVGLCEVERVAQNDDHDDDARVHRLPERGRRGSRDEQDDNQRVQEQA